jgi:DNA-binding transcriptional LysR family regulator
MGRNELHSVTLRHALAFVAVAGAGSFTQAADQLHLSQPALTSRIQQLEQIVGVQLFERTTRVVSLTAAGEEFLQIAERLIESYAAVSRDVDAIARRRPSELIIGSIPSAASSLLVAPLQEFVRLCPDTSIRIMTGLSSVVRNLVAQGKAELGLVSITAASKELSSITLATDPIGIVCRKDHPFAATGRVLAWKDLEGYALHDMGFEQGIRNVLEHLPELANCLSLARYRLPSSRVLSAVIEASNGVAILPESGAPIESRSKIVFVKVINPAINRSLSIVMSRKRELSEQAKSMLQVLLRYHTKDTALVHVASKSHWRL